MLKIVYLSPAPSGFCFVAAVFLGKYDNTINQTFIIAFYHKIIKVMLKIHFI